MIQVPLKTGPLGSTPAISSNVSTCKKPAEAGFLLSIYSQNNRAHSDLNEYLVFNVKLNKSKNLISE